jgi:hypothetical protein
MGWRADPAFALAVQHFHSMMSVSVSHCAIALQALDELVEDMDTCTRFYL